MAMPPEERGDSVGGSRRFLADQQDRLLNLRLSDDLDQATYARKGTEIRDRLASIKLQLDAADRSGDEMAELASKVFDLDTQRRESCPHNKKALRRTRRRADS